MSPAAPPPGPAAVAGPALARRATEPGRPGLLPPTGEPAGHHRPLDGVRPFDFVLPEALEATVPPEGRGLTRDAVRMMVARRSDQSLTHAAFPEVPRFVDEGDVVVVNTSGTLAAELDATGPGGERLHLHLSTALPAGLWTVELRRHGRAHLGASAGATLVLPAGGAATLLTAYAPGPGGRGGRLWVATLDVPGPLHTYLAVHGRPIRYGYVQGSWPLSTYQNVYATEPGSAEMPSAGRPFTADILMRLMTRGVSVVPVLLHTGVASLEASEPPYPEYFRVPARTAHLVNDAHRAGTGRVVAIGTTVVRALHTVTDGRGRVHAGQGWTEAVVTPADPPLAVDGLLTGWHEPAASHLAMLEAVAGRALLEESYRAALDEGYLWHEFGDVHLVLP